VAGFQSFAVSNSREEVPRRRSGGFDTGAAAVRLPAIGPPSQVGPISPMKPPRGVPVSNPPRLRDFPGFQRPRFRLSRQPTGRERPAARERSGSAFVRSRVGGRERPLGAALKPYRKFSQGPGAIPGAIRVLSRLILYT
jgi:hypothetical protein